MTDVVSVTEILTDKAATGSSDALSVGSGRKTVQATGTTSAGSGAATIVVEVSNNTSWPWLTAGTISLTLGTSATSDGIVLDAKWAYVRARVSAISGTGAKVSVNVGL